MKRATRRRIPYEDDVSSERWLVSYADFITLLFAFFTTLYAISTIDAQKMGKMVTSMRAEFDSGVFGSGSRNLALSQGSGSASSMETLRGLAAGRDPAGAGRSRTGAANLAGAGAARPVLKGPGDLERFKKNVEHALGAGIASGVVLVHLEPRGLTISLGERGVFDSGSDEIRPDGRALLDALAADLVTVGNHIRIEGHTDDVPIHNSRFPSNWELSTARATVVVSYLIRNYGFRPDRLSAAGYAEYRPVVSNESEEGKARNRRVDIILLNPVEAAAEPK